ncbi:MAG TPA: flagellar hook-associated protein FlgL [Kineosporiaceae bacterium]|nr:flagellar hook-associated protein FlgL [Kineosporiaceae bacterium]
MSFRVTQSTTASVMLQGIETSYDGFETLSSQIASGQAITKPSDNPAGTVQVMSYNAELTRLGQYQSNANDGMAWLGTADSVLSSVTTQLQRVQQLAEQGANGTTDATGRAAIANEIDSIKSSLLASANTSYLGRPIFGGTTGGTTAFDTNGNYVGDSGAVNRTLAPGTSVQVNLVGTDVFGTGPANVFAVLTQLSADLRSGSASAGTTDLTAVQQAMSQVQTAQATVGSRTNEVQQLLSQAQARQTTVTEAKSSVADLDLAKAETELSTQQLTYEAALQATSHVLSLSLVQFLQ